MEALIRWNHPERRPGVADGVHPDRRRNRPDRADRALGAAGSLHADAAPDDAGWVAICVSVNVSARQLGMRLSRRSGRPWPHPASRRIPGAGTDRERADRKPRTYCADPARTERPRGTDFGGRFRNRLFGPDLPPPLPGGRTENRPLVRGAAISATSATTTSSRPSSPGPISDPVGGGRRGGDPATRCSSCAMRTATKRRATTLRGR